MICLRITFSMLALNLFLHPVIAAPISLPPNPDHPGRDPAIISIIEAFSGTLPEKIKKEDIPGFAFAVVDPDTILWMECFGFTDENESKKINEATIFSVQSISKSFTALAILHAVEEGLLDLNKPVKHYLPDFTVHSSFDEDPMQIITLKHLLSHTAGFTHEAPVGNNFNPEFDSFEDHVRSIAETWLKFPVGEGYSYSNLGIDLAGWILEKQSGLSFPEYVRKNLLKPLKMSNSSFDTHWITQHENRAKGYSTFFPQIPVAIPLIPSGGLYTSIEDMARYVQFHLNRGNIDGAAVLRTDLLDTMYTIPFPDPGQQFGYALGIARRKMNNSLLLNHGGGGFGFLSFMMWYPEYDFGIITLSNYDPNDLHRQLANDLSGLILAHIHEKKGISFEPEENEFPSTVEKEPQLPVPGPDDPEWANYTGIYRIKMYDQPIWKVLLNVKEGYLHFNGQPLTEHIPGLFFDRYGEAIDLRGNTPTYRNISMARIPFPGAVKFIAVFSAFCLLGFAAGWPVMYMIRRRKMRISIEPAKRWPVIYLVTGSVISLVLLAYLYLLVFEVPFILYDPFPWYHRYPLYVKIILVLPLVTVVFLLFLIATTIDVWTKARGFHYQRILYSLVAAGTVCLLFLLLHWQQFGTFI